MKVQNTSRTVSFKGLIPASTLKELAKKNTLESKRLLNSCLGFNAVYKGAENLNPDKVARQIQDKFHINTDFGNNPIVASFCALTANIFQKLGWAKPTGFFLRNFNGTYYQNALGICMTHKRDDSLYSKFKKDFPLRSVIMNSFPDWWSIQECMIPVREQNHFSTNHFLAPFIHEFVHSAHYAHLLKKYKDGTEIMNRMQREFTNQKTIVMIQKETSNYGAQSPCELIAEEMTELIVNSLDPKTILPDVKVFKMLRKQEPNLMDELIDASWNYDEEKLKKFDWLKSQVCAFMYDKK